MVDTVKQLRIFIASSGDCILEREAVRRVCNEDHTILTICRANHISLDVFGWEDVCSNIGRPQSIINVAVEKFNPDWFVFIFWHRFGSDAGLGMTGTEEEWNLARQLNEKGGGHPRVSIFFNKKSAPPHEQDDYQLEALRRFREAIFNEYQALACFFDGTRDFEKKFQAHLTDILLNLGGGHREITIDRLRQELLLASNVLLNYQRTLMDGRQIERLEFLEFTELLQRIEESEHSTTLVLGSPGSGKSSLLSTLAHHLKEKGMPVLAIKADTLSTDVNTVEDLRKVLDLSLDVRDGVLALAEREKVVVIIDQLDAVSELLDRKSGRLNVLLNLIHNLSGQKSVHIIASSREFECRHDVRLNSVNAEKVTLELPAWGQIASILEQAGHETNGMSDELKEYLSLRTRQVKAEEERAFPGSADCDGGVSGGWIGPRLKADEMAKASDGELMNLFNQLPDGTQWDNPKRRWEDFSRSGGSVQQSREFRELAKIDPHRAVRLIASLEPGRHETYAGAGLDGLAESGLPLNELTTVVENLDKRGFSSGHFREGAASAFEKLAGRENSLPEEVLSLLEKWVAEHPEPNWPEMNEPKEEKAKEIKGSILFGTGGLFFLPHGRGTMLRAITAGYLERQPPDYNNWARIVKSRLRYEKHPNVWALTMMHMPVLFNGDPEEATRMYDAVIRTCPQVLEKQVAFYSIARVMPWCCPNEILHEWLDKIKACSSDLNRQAYGEMLFLYHCHYRDSWSSDRIMSILSERDDCKIH
ncbi:MAG: AAA family ATPase [Firmicutes bacterium]|nr:AAA family ATPase [Bacillota bacterium]